MTRRKAARTQHATRLNPHQHRQAHSAGLLLRLSLRALPSRREIRQLLSGLDDKHALWNSLRILEQAKAARRRNKDIRVNLDFNIFMTKDKGSPAAGLAGEGEELRSNVATSNASSGTKRKRAGEPRFYAVQAGRKPGVYSNWNDCLAQVKGFKGAVCAFVLPPSAA